MKKQNHIEPENEERKNGKNHSITSSSGSAEETLSDKRSVVHDYDIKEEGDVHPAVETFIYEEEDVKEFIKKVEEIVTRRCMGTSANCYEIKKEIKEEAGEKLT